MDFSLSLILLQAAVGGIVLVNEVRQRLRGGAGFRLPSPNRLPVFINDILFWIGVSLWVSVGASWHFFSDSRSALLPLSEQPVALLQWGGICVGLMAVFLIYAGILSLGFSFRTSIDYNESPRLITTGIYRWLRNPMAFGLLLHGWAALLLHQSIIALLAALTLTVTNLLRVRFEEQYLRGALGRDYERYCRQTGRFIPRISRK